MSTNIKLTYRFMCGYSCICTLISCLSIFAFDKLSTRIAVLGVPHVSESDKRLCKESNAINHGCLEEPDAIYEENQ